MSDDATTTPAVHGAWTPDGETPPATPKVSEDAIITMLKTVFDPEIPVDIYELGLIYAVEIADDGAVKVEMTLTTPSCPSAQELPAQVEEAVKGRSLAEVERLFEGFHRAVTSDARTPVDVSGLGKLEVLAGVREFPMRVKCATLAWHTLRAALHGEESASTE